MFLQKISRLTISLIILVFSLNSCGGQFGADARKYPPNPEERVKKNIEEGRGFRLMDSMKKGSGNFEFASSNPLWRASLDTIDFMPLASVNYSGGIIITDWYAANTANESIKIWNKSINTRIKKFFLFLRINSLKIAKDFGDILLINLFIIFNKYLYLVSYLLLTRIFLNLFLFTILRIVIFKVNTYKKIKNF